MSFDYKDRIYLAKEDCFIIGGFVILLMCLGAMFAYSIDTFITGLQL